MAHWASLWRVEFCAALCTARLSRREAGGRLTRFPNTYGSDPAPGAVPSQSDGHSAESRFQRPVVPSIASRSRSACPLCGAYSWIMWTWIIRSDMLSPVRWMTMSKSSSETGSGSCALFPLELGNRVRRIGCVDDVEVGVVTCFELVKVVRRQCVVGAIDGLLKTKAKLAGNAEDW